MSQPPADPRRFLEEMLPTQWNEALREQERTAEAAKRLLEGMRSVEATLCVEIEGEGGGRFNLNVSDGRLTPGETASHPPFLTMRLDRPDFERFAAEVGDSALGFLGALSGLGQEMRLTSARVELLASLEGTVRFELRGEGGFTLLTHFGTNPPPAEPTTSITVDRTAYHALRTGELNPQDAFLSGQIQVEGDMQLAMQLALAALTPD
ncbi:MAG: SCP2 sterol-binding domain-containing protein [Myxococcota bacterium]